MKIKLSEIKIKLTNDGTIDNQRTGFDPIKAGNIIKNLATPGKNKEILELEQERAALDLGILNVFLSIRSAKINIIPMVLDNDYYLVAGHVRYACLLGINAEYAEVNILDYSPSHLRRLLLQGAENTRVEITHYEWVYFIANLDKEISQQIYGSNKIVTARDAARICGINQTAYSKYLAIYNRAHPELINLMQPPYNIGLEYAYNLSRATSQDYQLSVLGRLKQRPIPTAEELIVRYKNNMKVERAKAERAKEVSLQAELTKEEKNDEDITETEPTLTTYAHNGSVLTMISIIESWQRRMLVENHIPLDASPFLLEKLLDVLYHCIRDVENIRKQVSDYSHP